MTSFDEVVRQGRVQGLTPERAAEVVEGGCSPGGAGRSEWCVGAGDFRVELDVCPGLLGRVGTKRRRAPGVRVLQSSLAHEAAVLDVVKTVADERGWLLRPEMRVDLAGSDRHVNIDFVLEIDGGIVLVEAANIPSVGNTANLRETKLMEAMQQTGALAAFLVVPESGFSSIGDWRGFHFVGVGGLEAAMRSIPDEPA